MKKLLTLAALSISAGLSFAQQAPAGNPDSILNEPTMEEKQSIWLLGMGAKNMASISSLCPQLQGLSSIYEQEGQRYWDLVPEAVPQSVLKSIEERIENTRIKTQLNMNFSGVDMQAFCETVATNVQNATGESLDGFANRYRASGKIEVDDPVFSSAVRQVFNAFQPYVIYDTETGAKVKSNGSVYESFQGGPRR